MANHEANSWGATLNEHMRQRLADGLIAGDVCTLRSGGPWMTVINLRTDLWVDVTWFRGGGEVFGAFPAGALRRATRWDRVCAALGA